MTFIETIVNHLKTTTASNELKNHLYLFPSKRAVTLFNNLLQNAYPQDVFILPKVQTIQEFFIEQSDFIVADEYILLQELYKIHEAVNESNQSFHQFFSWGKLILKDFDEMDKYLVNTDYFFSVLLAHKEVEIHYDISEDIKKYFELFKNNIQLENQGPLHEAFLKTWQNLGKIHKQFNEVLEQKKIVYEGKAYKTVLEKIKQKQTSFSYTKIAFCGFNAFTTCEEQLLDTLFLQYNVETWWDIDSNFMSNQQHEAGNFLRHYFKNYQGKQHHWIDDKNTEQQINIVAMPTNVGQIHYVQQNINLKDNNCMVLCDESLLDYCLPLFDLNQLNITMGLSLKTTALFELLTDFITLLSNSSQSENYIFADTQDLIALFSSNLFQEQVRNKQKLYQFLYASNEKVKLDDIAPFIDEKLFNLLQKSFHQTTIFIDLLHLLELVSIKSDNDKTILLALKEMLLKLKSNTQNDIVLTPKDALVILQMYIGNARMPLETDRKNSTQLMGFLETRLQDFDTIFILNLNDSILPGTNKTNSFIPYNLRKSFHLPTFDQFDGINAYHFYRLLKRGKTIHLLYNNSSIDNAEEKSRFIKQIEFEYDANTIKPIQYVMSNDEMHQIDKLVSVKKTEAMIRRLESIEYSASSLKIYNTCPIQFYLKYILNVKEPTELSSTIKNAEFGTIFHRLMELYYADSIRKSSPPTEQELLVYLNQTLKDKDLPENYFSGKFALNKKVLLQLAAQVINNDAQTPLEIIGLEKELFGKLIVNGKTITLKGNLDRIDKVDNQIRIIDYKTGKVELVGINDFDKEEHVQTFFSKIFGEHKKTYHEAFQGMLYAWLYTQNFPNTYVKVGFYKTKKINNGIEFLLKGQPITANLLSIFEEKLRAKLSEILDINTDFVINRESKSYDYSSYSDLLGF